MMHATEFAHPLSPTSLNRLMEEKKQAAMMVAHSAAATPPPSPPTAFRVPAYRSLVARRVVRRPKVFRLLS